MHAQDAPFEESFVELLRFTSLEPRWVSVASLQRVARAHRRNVSRIADTIRFALIGASRSRQEALWLAEACAEVGIPNQTHFAERDPNRSLVEAAYNRRAMLSTGPADGVHDLISLGTLNRTFSWTHAFHNDALQAVLQNQIVFAWTAFEVLAADLWIEALNFEPKIALELITTAQNQGSGLVNKDVGKTYSVDTFAKFGFDLSRNMGTILSQRYGNFLRLTNIERAYGDAAMALPMDGKAGTCLRLLEHLRNVIVHRGGVVDAEYKRKISSMPINLLQGVPTHFTCAEGDVLELSCGSVAEITFIAIKFCNAIIELVEGRVNAAERGTLNNA